MPIMKRRIVIPETHEQDNDFINEFLIFDGSSDLSKYDDGETFYTVESLVKSHNNLLMQYRAMTSPLETDNLKTGVVSLFLRDSK